MNRFIPIRSLPVEDLLAVYGTTFLDHYGDRGGKGFATGPTVFHILFDAGRGPGV